MLTNDIITDRLIIKSMREEYSSLCFSIWLDDESWYPFVAFLKDSNEFVGTGSLVPMEDSTHWDLGYCIHKKYWRQGYATELIKALINFGYTQGGRKFTADVAQENIASNTVMN